MPTTRKPKPTRALAAVLLDGTLVEACDECADDDAATYRKRHNWDPYTPVIPVEIRPLPKRRKRR